MTILLLLAAFALIILGAIGFTNAIEWLGHRLQLGTGAVGGLLAAVGTALPESLIPLVALLGGGGEEREQIAIGALIGAPFLLATLAMLLIAGAARSFRGRRDNGTEIDPHRESANRDLRVFIALFPVAIVLGVTHPPMAVLVAASAGLFAAYCLYVVRAARHGGEAQDEEELKSLWFDSTKDDPPNRLQIAAQLVVALVAIIGGAELFVSQVEHLAKDLGIDVLIIALVLAPLATEMPEKANSVLWVREGKDALALGNVTGAMVFQATVPITFGLLLTDWDLAGLAVAASIVAVAGAAVAAWAIRRRDFGGAPSLAWAALLAAFAVYAFVG